METTTATNTDRLLDASLSLHNILTFLQGYASEGDGRLFGDPETWIIFHKLILLLSMRDEYSYDEWAMVILAYTGGIIPTLEKKQQAGHTLVRDPGFILFDYMNMANWVFNAHPDNADKGLIRIFKALREHRNILLGKMDDVFAHLLVHSGLEIDQPYARGDSHELARRALELTTDMCGSSIRALHLQFETRPDVDADEVEESIFKYFTDKGYTTKGNFMNTGTVYDKEGKLIWNTSVTVDYGEKASVVLVSLTQMI